MKRILQALFRQLFRFINVQLFNRLLMCRCSLRNGQYLKAGLETVAHWISGAGADYIADPWEELKCLRQVDPSVDSQRTYVHFFVACHRLSSYCIEYLFIYLASLWRGY